MSIVFGWGVYLFSMMEAALRNTARRNHVHHTVVFKLLRDVLRIRLADRQTRVEARIGAALLPDRRC